MSYVPNEIVAVMVIPKGSRPKTHDGGGTEYDQ